MADLRDARVLVTGAAGFLGANLVRELLRSGVAVQALVRPGGELCRIADVVPELTLHAVDLLDRDALQRAVERARPAAVVHLSVRRADDSPAERAATLQANVLGTANLLEATASCDAPRFVHLGSSLEYGAGDDPLHEDALPRPATYYGMTKLAATLLCQQAARANGRAIVVLRPFNVYGSWEKPSRLVPTAIAAALHRREMALTAPGYRRDWVFVDDVVDACLRALTAEGVAGEVINIGSGEARSNEEVVDLVREITGRELSVRIGAHPARAWDNPFWIADISKAHRLLGWEPRHTLREGLERTVAWHLQHALHDVALAPASR
jgi:nucleoside-diphosphate-sugar epimerase